MVQSEITILYLKFYRIVEL